MAPFRARVQMATKVEVDREAAVSFLRLAYEPNDWVAVFLKSYDSGRVTQRVGPVLCASHERFQRWLLAMNAHGFNVYVSVNAVAAGKRTRTRDSMASIRHVFLEADHDGDRVLARLHARSDVPPPSYVLHSSPGRVPLFWRVRDFDGTYVERLQKQLASELDTVGGPFGPTLPFLKSDEIRFPDGCSWCIVALSSSSVSWRSARSLISNRKT